MKFSEIAGRFRIDKPEKFTLADHDAGGTAGLDIGKKDAKDMLEGSVKTLSELQERLYADDRRSLLLIFQAMDAAGKDSVIKHVMSGVNPQGCQVFSFKAPSAEELDHDFLWRIATRLPERGRIGIFNRSHYEEVLVVRVHPEILDAQKLPSTLDRKNIWPQRFESIRNFERHVAASGTCILKFFLNVSPDEQRKRFLDRLEEPEKYWKFSTGDVGERARWTEYMAAYQDMIRETSRPEAPWYVVPADHKWFTRLVVAAAVIDAMERMDLKFPKVDKAAQGRMEAIRKALQAEKPAEKAGKG
ncbi:MAG: polyphosphate kinase 2 family protein [Xanthobacteraceae bacterium]|uniref:polyphosphate kinase 2 family protein n=1 Tax=Pseudolabrys sp. TaxID=1960880 RepID=UPI003D0F2096